jgi:hypothetical protein
MQIDPFPHQDSQKCPQTVNCPLEDKLALENYSIRAMKKYNRAPGAEVHAYHATLGRWQ